LLCKNLSYSSRLATLINRLTID